MFTTNTIPARNLQKSYKTILEDVKANKSTVVLTTNNKPQAALINLDDFEELKRIRNKNTALEMLNLAIDNKEELKSLPADLRNKANSLLYTK